MSARESLFGFVEAGAQEEDLPTFAAAVAAALAEHLVASADALVTSFAWEPPADMATVVAVRNALRLMASGALPAPAPSAGVEASSDVEFGVRVPYGVLLATAVREDADTYLGRLRDMYPDAVLVQRTVRYGAWTEVQ